MSSKEIKYHWQATVNRKQVLYSTWIAFFAWVFAVYDFILFGNLLPKVGEHFNWSPADQASIITYVSIGSAIIIFIVGPIVDKLGRKTGIILTVGLAGLCSLLTAITGLGGGKPSIIAVRSISGLGYAEQGLNAVYLLEMYDSSNDKKLQKHKGIIYSLVQGGWPIGALLAAGITAILLPYVGWQGAFIFAAIPSFIICILALKLRESPKFLALKNYKQAKLAGNTKEAEYIAKHANINIQEEKAKGGIGDVFKYHFRSIFVLCLALLLNWFALQVFGVLGTTVITQVHHITFENSLFILVLSNLVSYLGYIFHGWLGDKFGRRNVLAIGWIIGGIIFAIMIYAPNDFTTVVILYSIGLFFLIGPYSAGMFFISESFPTQVRATASMLVTAMGPIGAVLASAGASVILSNGGDWLESALYFGVIPCIISGIVVFFAKRVNTAKTN